MQNKKGISLIVLVITIIVMIILAAAIIITLDNAGIINKANDAVEQSNLKQVQQLASLAWAEAYMDGKTAQADLEKAVLDALDKNKIDKSKYNITVTTDGVDVQLKNGELNEYGFYYGELYKAQIEENGVIVKAGFVFYENGLIEHYMSPNMYGLSAEGSDKLYMIGTIDNGVSYSKGKVTMTYDDGTEEIATFSNDGKSITLDGNTATCSFEEIKGVKKSVTYTGMYNISDSQQVEMSLVVLTDNKGTITYDDYASVTNNVEYIRNNNFFGLNTTLGSIDENLVLTVSTDGQYILVLQSNMPRAILKAENSQDDTEQDTTGHTGGLYDASGNLVASWDTLVNTYGLDVEKDYTEDTADGEGTLKYIMANNEGLSSATHLKVSDKVTKIGDYALCNTTLTKVTLSSSVKTLGQFSICASLNLETIEIPYGLEVIGAGAFEMDPYLKNIVIPNSVTTIGEDAFVLSSVTSLNVPASVTNLAPGFASWTNIISLTVDTANTVYKSIDDVIYTKDGKELIQIASGKQVDFAIPEGVTIIRTKSIVYSQITNLTIPASVETIEKYAIQDNCNLISVTFAANSKLKTIGRSAFYSNDNIVSIDIPEGVSVIEYNVFGGSSSLKSVTLPSTITSIAGAFENCIALSNVTIKATTPPSIEATLFENIDTLTSITVPAGTAELYKAAEGWSEYASVIVEATE